VYLVFGKKKTVEREGLTQKKVLQHIISNNGMLMNNDDDLNYIYVDGHVRKIFSNRGRRLDGG
jgi:prepilin-type processing-associated H-X9-DG protein